MEVKPDLQPLKFKPILKSKIWGDGKLYDLLGKGDGTDPNLGESWELSGVEGDISEVADGDFNGKDLQELIDAFGADLLGKKVYSTYGNQFPILIKFIDAADDLSIQVHPREGNENSKTEMWYVLDSDDGATLYSGFGRATNQDEVRDSISKGQLESLLSQDRAIAHDVFFLPSGRIHSIGKGILLAEIQQSSDTTYRIYDFNRRDHNGNFRELHIDEGLDALDYSHIGSNKKNQIPTGEGANLVSCPYFEVVSWKLIEGKKNRFENSKDSFIVIMATKGKAELDWGPGKRSIQTGETLLIPASIKNFEINPLESFSFLEIWVP